MAATVLVTTLSCVGGDAFGTGNAASIGLTPSFQILGTDFGAGPVDRIRATAFDATALTVVGTFEEDVDPAAESWEVLLGIDLGGESSLEVFVEVELLSEGVVQWSGRTGILTVRTGATPATQQVSIFRGPLDNLDVTSVSIVGAPAQLLVGESGTATAEIEFPAESGVLPTEFWGSLDEAVATVMVDQGVATITGVGVGTTSIVLAAGPESDEVAIEVLPRVQSVVVSPATTAVDVIGLQIQFSAEVTNGFGVTTLAEAVTWASTDPAVASVDGSGLVTTAGFGTTTIEATAVGVTGSGTVMVNGPDLVVSSFSVTPDGTGTILDFSATTFDVVVENQGSALAAATDLDIRVLDAGDASEAHPTLSYPVGPINPGETETLQVQVGQQGQSVVLPTLLVFEAVADAGDVVPETNEFNNTSLSGTVDVVPAPPQGFDLYWIGVTDADWDTGTNWSAGQVPQPTDNTYIGAATNQPVLGGSATVADLTVEAAATLTLADAGLTVTGDLDAGQTIEGIGSVELSGSGVTVAGSIEPELLITGTARLDGNVITDGNVVVDGQGASLSIEGLSLTVGSDLVTRNGGVLEMAFSTDEVVVLRNASFTGGDTEGLLTDGVLRVIGDFTAGGPTVTSFAASGAHLTTFEGSAGQDVTFSEPEDDRQRFASVRFDHQGTVTLNSYMVVLDVLDVASGTVDGTGQFVAVGGGLIDSAGGLTAQALFLAGNVTQLPASLPFDVVVDQIATVVWPTDATVDGDLTIDGSLDVSTTTLDVTGGVFSNNALTVPAGGTLNLTGVIELAAGSLFDIDGTVTAVGGCVNNGAVITGSGTQPCGSGQFSKVWVGGDVDGPTDTENPNNWAPLGVPAQTDDVLIPVTANDPVVTASGIVNSVTVDDGVIVDMGGFQLGVVGDIDVGTPGMTNGEVVAGGSGSILQGNFDDLRIEVNRRFSGAVDLTGDLTVANATLAIGGQTVGVGGNLTIQGSGGRLDMRSEPDLVDVEGNVLFDGGTHTGWLTEGSIRVSGDFTANATNSTTSFLGQANHSVTLDGTGPQVVTLSNPATNQHTFRRLNIDNTGSGVTFASTIVATGGIDVDVATTLDASDDLIRVGTLFLISPTTTLFEVQIISDLSAISSTIPADVTVNAGFNVPNSFTVTGDFVTNRTTNLAGNTLTVLGNATTSTSSGRFDMRNASDLLDVDGDLLFDGATETGWLTQGEIRAAGDFTANATNSTTSFLAQMNHIVTLDGSGAQTVTLSNPATNQHAFRNLFISNTGPGVTFGSTIVSTDAFFVDAASTLDASDDLIRVGGSFIISPTTTLLTVDVIGDLSAISATIPADVTVNAGFTIPSSFTVTGDFVTNNTLAIGANVLQITGNLTTQTSSGRLDMRAAGGAVGVDGNVLFGGATESGWLTEGDLFVGGDFTASATNSTQSYFGTGNHTLIFDGVVSQLLTLSNPASNQQAIRNLDVTNDAGGVTLGSDIYVTNAITIGSTSTFDASDDVISVGGALTISPLTTLQDIVVVGDLTTISSSVTADFTVNAGWSLSNGLTITGDLLTTNTLNLAGNTLVVSGNATTSGSGGRFDMRNPVDILDVGGDLLFDGGTEVGWLTEGLIIARGNFTSQSTNSATSFVGTSNHEVRLDGTGAQVVTLANPASNGDRFNELSVRNLTGPNSAGSDLYITRRFFVDSDGGFDASDDVLFVGGQFDISSSTSLQELVVIADMTLIDDVPAPMTVNVALNVPNSFTVTGDLVTNNTFAVGPNSVTVTGNVTTQTSSGRLDMRDPLSFVSVGGNMLFDGGTEVGWMTDGILAVDGDFTSQSTNSSSSFVGTSNHVVSLIGNGLQTVTLANPASNGDRFNVLDVLNVNGSTLVASDLWMSNGVTMVPDATVDASDDTFFVGGLVDLSGGTSLQHLVIIGDLSSISTPIPGDVTVDVTFNVPNPFTVQGNLVTNSTLVIGANTVTVAGDLTTQGSSGRLDMRVSGGVLDVAGDAFFNGGTEVGWMTLGELQLAGSLTATSTNSVSSFVGSSGHMTRFDGSGLQQVSFDNAATNGQRFGDFQGDNFTTGIEFLTDVVVSDEFIVQAGGIVNASDDVLFVAGAYQDGSDGIQIQELVIYGDLASHSTSVAGDVTVTSSFTMKADLFVSGDLVTNNPLTVGANDLFVNGSLSVLTSNGRLVMQDALGLVTIGGDALFDGGTSLGWMDDGQINLAGDLTAAASFSVASFSPTGNHNVHLIGSSPQSINFSNPAATAQRFNSLEISNFFTLGVVLETDTYVNGIFDADDSAIEITRPGLATSVLHVRGTLSVSELTIDQVPIRVESSVLASSHSFDNVFFQNMVGTDTQLYLEVAGSGTNPALNMSSITFDEVLTSGGFYLNAQSSNDQAWRAEMNNPSPGSATENTHYLREVAYVTVVWPWP